MIRSLFIVAVLAVGPMACAGAEANAEALQNAAKSYKRFLRWTQFEHAATFLPVQAQAAFLDRYMAAERDLNIQSIEVRAIDWRPEADSFKANVTVIAEVYRLPSTVVKKVVMIQRWELQQERWVLVESTRELVPLDPNVEGVKHEPALPTEEEG